MGNKPDVRTAIIIMIIAVLKDSTGTYRVDLQMSQHWNIIPSAKKKAQTEIRGRYSSIISH
jgi:hypothetical protein